MRQERLGVVYSLGAYLLWGAMPLYLKAVAHVPPLAVLSHRVLWSFLLLSLVLVASRRLTVLRRIAAEPKLLVTFVVSALLLSVNWLVYIFAVGAGRVVDASFGYFVNPLVSVLLGVIVLREKLRPAQRVAVALSAAGVLWLTLLAGQLPWIGLVLAASFGSYGLLRKTARLDALEGLWLETAVLVPLAAGHWSWTASAGSSAWANADLLGRLLLMAAGPVTAVPLLLFAAGARKLPLSLVGLLQYCSPTIQLLLGVFLFHEPFRPLKIVGYSLVWLSLLVVSLEGVWFNLLRRSTLGGWQKRS